MNIYLYIYIRNNIKIHSTIVLVIVFFYADYYSTIPSDNGRWLNWLN